MSTRARRLAAPGLVASLLLGACREEPVAEEPAPIAAPAELAAPTPAARCPAEMAPVATYCIDRHEAHLVDAEGLVHPPFDRPKPQVRYRARSAPGVVPQGYVSRIEAASACEASGKRLCRAREWYGACAGARNTRHPYGDVEIAGRCNTGKPHLLSRLFGRRVHLTFAAHYNSPKLNREPGFLEKTGELAECVSEAGVFDMVGNLHEWVADDVSRRLGQEVPLEYGLERLGAAGSGVFMGGYFSSTGEHGAGCAYVTATHAPDYHDYSTGFRCCKDQPS